MKRAVALALVLTCSASAGRRYATDITVGASIAGGVNSLLNIRETWKAMRAAGKKAGAATKKVVKKAVGKK